MFVNKQTNMCSMKQDDIQLQITYAFATGVEKWIFPHYFWRQYEGLTRFTAGVVWRVTSCMSGSQGGEKATVLKEE